MRKEARQDLLDEQDLRRSIAVRPMESPHHRIHSRSCLRWRFSLRGLMLLTLLISLGLGCWYWLASILGNVRQEERALSGLYGGSYVCRTGRYNPGVAWLAKALDGDEPFKVETLIAVVDHGPFGDFPGLNDDELMYVGELKHLGTLNLANTRVTDAGMVHLRGLTRLTRLNLEWTHVSDAGLVQVKRLTQLKVLYLRGTRVTDAGVKELKLAIPNCHIEH